MSDKTHYHTRLEHDLKEIRTRLADVAGRVRISVEEAVDALAENDRSRLYQVMLNDPHVNRETRKIDALCHAFIARHLPAAGHLRFVSSALRLSIALERIGDYAVTIARVGVRLEEKPPVLLLDDLKNVSDRSCKMLNRATIAFVTGDTTLAQETASMARKIDKRHDKFFEKLMKEDAPLLLQTVRLLTIMSKLERVSDQAKNMCEEVLFVTTGENKASRTPRILFVDEKNSFLSPLAVALSQKAFPNSGKYSSSGWAPVESIDDRLEKVADNFGLDIDASKPQEVQPFRQAMAKYSIIVAINGGENPPLPLIPFHSILLNWTVDEELSMEEQVRHLSSLIQDMMIRYRGEDAS